MRIFLSAFLLLVAGVAAADKTVSTVVSCSKSEVTSAEIQKLPDAGWSVHLCGIARSSDGGVMKVDEGTCDLVSVGPVANINLAARAATWVNSRCQ